ncbi:MAG: basic amino acid ABC transporter substrate-binding protein [Clostridiales bacterium]|nr:basic amino acid ABC transporter substrate-binding protein [Clostridiales bacterium]
MKKFFAVCMMVALLLSGTAIAEDGVLVMATNPEFPPFEYVEGEEVVGLDVDIAKEIAKDLGKELEVAAMEFVAIIPAINSGKADFGIAGMTVTEDRKLSVDFSDVYHEAVQACIVKKGSVVTDYESLQKAIIGVQQATTGDTIVSAFEGAQVQRFPKGLDAFMQLANGKIDAVVIDAPVAANILKALNNPELEKIEMPFEAEFYAIAVPKGKEELLTAINATIKRIEEDGTMEALLEKYFPAE